MKVQRRISVPGGELPATPALLNRPYRISLSHYHPRLTLGDYFSAAERFLLREDHRERLAGLIGGDAGGVVPARDITCIRIRSEKHGALYHVSRVEVCAGALSFRLALSAAVSEEGKLSLGREWNTLAYLDETFRLPYLPQPYFRGEAGGRGREGFSMLASQWFEGFSEWHLSMDGRSRTQGLAIWDGDVRDRWAEEREVLDIYRNAAAILTSYYDTRTCRQIYPWRHAAGDFVVRTALGAADVRLTTARDYVRVMDRVSGEAVDPIIALVYFFLDLVTRMRLDRLDGTGAVAWAGVEALEGAVLGFLEAQMRKRMGRGCRPGDGIDPAPLLKRFAPDELEKAFRPLLRLYESGHPEDLHVIVRNLATHIRDLHRIIQALPPAGLSKAP